MDPQTLQHCAGPGAGALHLLRVACRRSRAVVDSRLAMGSRARDDRAVTCVPILGDAAEHAPRLAPDSRPDHLQVSPGSAGNKLHSVCGNPVHMLATST